MLLRDAPGGHRRLVHLFEIVFPTNLLLRQSQFRDGHIRREAFGPTYCRFLNGHMSQISAELDLDVELVGSRAQLRYERRPEDLFGRSEIESSLLNTVSERLNRSDTNLGDVVAMTHRAHRPICREDEILGLGLREMQEGTQFLPGPLLRRQRALARHKVVENAMEFRLPFLRCKVRWRW